MAFEDYKNKPSVVIVYTGDGKGKTSAGLGLLVRSLGNRNKVAFIQFIKHWSVSEHVFIRDIQTLYKENLYFYKGGKGFYNADDLSPKDVTEDDHKQAAKDTFDMAKKVISCGEYDLVILDEINNAVNDGLITVNQVEKLIDMKAEHTSLCLTGRNFPEALIHKADIVTNMTKVKHHFDDKFLANKGIDF